MSDSTRAESPGYTPSERTVGEAFRGIMEGLEGRVIVATFASNIARIQQVFDAAGEFGRKVTVIGRSMEQNTRIASDLGYLHWGPGQQVPKDRLKDVPDKEICIATTGSQGEPMAGLARMANRDHRFVEIVPGDTVIVSASPIPGNEESVARTIDNLFKVGANVYYHAIRHAHVSGHASQEELKLMLNLTKPKSFIPIHGEFRMLVQHGRLAAECGVSAENIFIIENGQPIEFFPDGRVRRGTPIEAGRVFVDGLSVGEVGDVVLRDRRALANDGMFLIVVTVDKQTGSLVGKPEIVTRGFVGRPRAIAHRGCDAAGDARPRRAGRPAQRDRAAQGADQGQPLAVPLRPDASASDGAAGRGRGLMATGGKGRRGSPRSTSSRASARSRTKASPNAPRTARAPLLAPGTVRSIVGIVLLVIGGLTLVALFLGGQGVFGQFVTDVLRPSFGQGAWLLGVLLIVAGVTVERSATVHSGWGVMAIGGVLVFLAGEGLIHLLSGLKATPADLSKGGGRHRPWAVALAERPRRSRGCVPGPRGPGHRGPAAHVRPDAAGPAAAGLHGWQGARERHERDGRGHGQRGPCSRAGRGGGTTGRARPATHRPGPPQDRAGR